MISIFVSTESVEKVKQCIAQEYRLQELVTLHHANDIVTNSHQKIIITDGTITVNPDWYNDMPPVLFLEKITYSEEALLGIIFCQLGNFEKSYHFLMNHPAILQTVDLLNRLMNNIAVDELFIAMDAANFTQLHNHAIAALYGNWEQEQSAGNIQHLFIAAMNAATLPEQKVFTAKHFATFLNDNNELGAAEELLQPLMQLSISNDALIELKAALCSIWMKQLTVPYNETMLDKLKINLWECLQHYEAGNRKAEAALILIDASQVANFSNSFTESLGYINKAVMLLQDENLTRLKGTAVLRKAILLYTWAQNGQPQFYRTAMQAFQECLTIFDREAAPDVFADIHHHLGVIYSEIQDEVKKRGVWAAVSVSSFTEALNFYNKVDYPYEFAMICHHFGNAYTRYPAALHSDNFDKALAWYREALDIRTAENYPLERCHTLSNYLATSWSAANPDEHFNEDRFNDMLEKAIALKQLSTDPTIRNEALEHLEKLKELKEQFV